MSVSIGVHPHQAHQFAADPERAATVVREQLRRRRWRARVGEIGLDYHYDFSPRDVQQRCSARRCALARELDRPVVIHTREADEDTVAILREEGGGQLRGVLHCFTGTAGAGRRRPGPRLLHLAGRHHHVPEGRGAASRPRARVPLDRLLTETDSPFLAPVPYRGKRNEPAYVARVVDDACRAAREAGRATCASGPPRISTRCSGRDKVSS